MRHALRANPAGGLEREDTARGLMRLLNCQVRPRVCKYSRECVYVMYVHADHVLHPEHCGVLRTQGIQSFKKNKVHDRTSLHFVGHFEALPYFDGKRNIMHLKYISGPVNASSMATSFRTRFSFLSFSLCLSFSFLSHCSYKKQSKVFK